MPLIAQWIWPAGDPMPRNVLMQFRRTFTLAAMPSAAVLHLSADTRYQLYLNGLRLGYGPARNYHYHYEYDTYDLTAYVHAGVNVLAVAVSHWGEGTFHQRVGRAGLLAQLDIDGQPYLWTDAQWKAKSSAAHRQDTPRIACQMAWEEQVDAGLEDVGWTTVNFDDSAWATSTVIGPMGTAPWGTLSPRSIPFLTDEPLAPVRAHALGLVRRPEVVAAIHAGPYLAPGDLTANRQIVDGLMATVLRTRETGSVRLKHCSIAGGAPPQILIDGLPVEWQLDDADVSATLTLAGGDHLVLMDWRGKTHDMDITLTASGTGGLSVHSPLPGDSGTWAIAVNPGETRATARAAVSISALVNCGADWQPVKPMDTPGADVYMDITASVPLQSKKQLTHWPIHVPPAPTGQAQHYLIDFGREVIGWIELDVAAAAGATLDVLGFEGVQEGRPQMTTWINNTLRYICREGRHTYISTVRRGFRYLIVAVHGATAETVLHHISLRLSTYPWNTQGAFRCSDPRLNQIWELCNYTLRLCSEDTFTDCPAYEQTLWTGDACYSDVLLHLAVHGDPRLTRRVLLLVADSLQRLPIAGAQVPGDWETDMLPNWSWLWAMGCGEHYFHTGDAEFARLVYPALATQAAFIEAARNPAGLVELKGFWHLLDWAAIPDDPNEILAHESCLASAALNATAQVARAAGQATAAEHWHRLANELAAAVNRECWREDRQAYQDVWRPAGFVGPALASSCDGNLMVPVDGVSQPTNIAALLAGVAPGARAEAILPNLLVCPPDWVPVGSPWMHSLGGEQVARRGQLAPVLNSIRDRWGDMLDKGATTTWEIFSGFGALKGWWTRSWCHAWSAYPAYLLSAYALGVRPLEPGFKRALIEPQLCDLVWAEGQIPTPHGPIAVRVERLGQNSVTHVTLPDGVAGEVRLSASRAPVITGTEAEVTQLDSQFVIRLPAGAHARIIAD